MREAEFDTASNGTTDRDVFPLVGASPIDESCSRAAHLSQKYFDASVTSRNLHPSTLCKSHAPRGAGTVARSFPVFFGGRR
jgi:hypothetical protein